MEIVAMDMKLRGMYIARQLSFQGIVFDTCFYDVLMKEKKHIPFMNDFI